jgi:protein-tyrosine phosphatase
MLVLTARQHQQPAALQPGLTIIQAPLTDDAFCIVKGNKKRAAHAATSVVQKIRARGKVMITCSEGMNRSGWVAALATKELSGCSGEQVIKLIQQQRPGALYNWFFQEHLKGSKEV